MVQSNSCLLIYFAEPINIILSIPFKVADVPYKCGGFEGDKGFKQGTCLKVDQGIQLPEEGDGPRTVRTPERCAEYCKLKSDKVGRPACCAFNLDEESCYWADKADYPLIVKDDKYKSVRCVKGYIQNSKCFCP